MFAEYERGRTPNPDVLCNREIKFDVFLKAAMELGADYVATGHYCQKRENSDGTFSLLAGADKNKDQSYFLCQISQEQLSKALFPIGALEKSEVREIALKNNLVTATKKDSQGLCFVGKIALPTFLQQQLAPKQGNVIEIPMDMPQFLAYSEIPTDEAHVEQLAIPFEYEEQDGQKVTSHQGAPSFVIGINTDTNTVYSGQTEGHPGLNRIALKLETSTLNWINRSEVFETENSLKCDIRIRYRQSLQSGTLIKKNDAYYILFDSIQKGITPGQFAAWYQDGVLIGSAVIAH
jgi:tRNA-specific 2-thiouridylase